jgi:sterol desaturase/sphingolipid hydroxylase (fatty acid hydroxylase superfamily)
MTPLEFVRSEATIALRIFVNWGLVAAGVGIVLEQLIPRDPKSPRRIRHALHNFALWYVAVRVARLTPFGLLVPGQGKLNLLKNVGLWTPIFVILSFVIYDFVRYWAHRAMHEVPLLWRIHRPHHSDPHVDFSTGFRVHPLETIFTLVPYIVVGRTLGLDSLWGAVIMIQFQIIHANVALPTRLERMLDWLVVTPGFHRIHHSRIMVETNSHYGVLLTIWDRLFGTAGTTGKELRCGLDEFDDPKWSTVWGMLWSPFPTVAPAVHASEEASSIEPLSDAAPPSVPTSGVESIADRVDRPSKAVGDSARRR